MAKEGLKSKLDDKAELAVRFIGEALYLRDDVNKSLLDDHKAVLLSFQKSGDINILRELRAIEARPIHEGAKTDFTTGMSLPIDGEYTSLGQLILEIEDLVFEIEGGEN